MQYHMPHEVEKKKKEEIFTPLDELTLSQHSKLGHRCDACKLGHIHPPLETSGQKIERPRSALSPNTVKPAEIWTPQKAFAVAEELSLSSIKRPKTAPLHRRNVPLLSPLGSNNDASSPTTPKNQTKRFNGTRPQSAFSRTGNNANNRNKSHRKNQTNSSNSNRRSNNNNNNNNNKNERKNNKKKQHHQNNSNNADYLFDSDYENDEENYRTPVKQTVPFRPHVHNFQYPNTSGLIFSPSQLEAIGPLCRRGICKNYACICSCCGAKEQAEEDKKQKNEAIRLKDLLKKQEEEKSAKLKAEKRQREAELRKKEKEMKQKLIMLRKKAIYQKCTCFIKNSKRYEGNDKLAMHCKTCPMRNLIRFNKKKKKTLRSLNTLNLSYHDHQSSTFDEVKMASP